MRIRIVATETIVYRHLFDLEELEKAAGVLLKEVGVDVRLEYPEWTLEQVEAEAIDRFAYILQLNAQDEDTGPFSLIQRLERHGDVQGQEWKLIPLDDEKEKKHED